MYKGHFLYPIKWLELSQLHTLSHAVLQMSILVLLFVYTPVNTWMRMMPRFEWDSQKEQDNVRKHRLTFEQAMLIWERPLLNENDDRFDYGERRYKATGLLPNLLCIVVVYTKRNRTIRIISLVEPLKMKDKTTMKKVDTPQAHKVSASSSPASREGRKLRTDQETALSLEQIATLKEAGFTSEQIAALPGVLRLTSEQIYLAKTIGAIPRYEGELTLEELAALPDDTIDFSDIPELDEEFWKNAVLTMPEQNKELISIRLDPDVLEYFRRPGAGYQTRINAVLRLWMKAHPNPLQ